MAETAGSQAEGVAAGLRSPLATSHRTANKDAENAGHTAGSAPLAFLGVRRHPATSRSMRKSRADAPSRRSKRSERPLSLEMRRSLQPVYFRRERSNMYLDFGSQYKIATVQATIGTKTNGSSGWGSNPDATDRQLSATVSAKHVTENKACDHGCHAERSRRRMFSNTVFIA